MITLIDFQYQEAALSLTLRPGTSDYAGYAETSITLTVATENETFNANDFKHETVRAFQTQGHCV
jgi:hypothetical protein